MGDFTALHGSRMVRYSVGNDYVVSVGSSATANTKGAWVEVDAATDFIHESLWLTFRGDTREVFLFDLGVGAASSEVVIIPDIMLQAGDDRDSGSFGFPMPISIPSGTRVSARCQVATTGVETPQFTLHGVAGGFASIPRLSRVTSYGSDTSDSTGAGIDPGASADTKGAYTELTGSTTNPIKWMCIIIGGKGNGVAATTQFLVDIAVGAATSEVVVVPNLNFRSSSTGDPWHPMSWWFPISVPAGTRLSARGQTQITDATDRLFDVIVLGVD